MIYIIIQVTFRDAESARRACANPNPMIDGRRANCNIAAMGRPRPSPPRGRYYSLSLSFLPRLLFIQIFVLVFRTRAGWRKPLSRKYNAGSTIL